MDVWFVHLASFHACICVYILTDICIIYLYRCQKYMSNYITSYFCTFLTTETEKHRQSLARLHQLHQASPQLGTQRFHRQVASMFCFFSPFFVFFSPVFIQTSFFCQVFLLDFVKLFKQSFFFIKFFFKCFFFKIIHSRRSSFIKICFEFFFRVLFIFLFTNFFLQICSLSTFLQVS